MSDLERALALVLGIEGEFSDRDRAADPGGRTNHGITQTTYDAWRRKKGLPPADVKNITIGEVQTIYGEEYWRPAGCDRLPWPINLLVFDFAVNSGVGRAVRALQTALKVTPDGIVGPVTTAMAAEKVRDKEWLGLFLADRINFMMVLSNWHDNRRGWPKRLFLLSFEVGKAL